MSDINSLLNPNTTGPENHTVSISGGVSQILSVAECAKELGYSDQAITKAIRERRLNAFKVGRAWLIEKAEFDKYRERL